MSTAIPKATQEIKPKRTINSDCSGYKTAECEELHFKVYHFLEQEDDSTADGNAKKYKGNLVILYRHCCSKKMACFQ